MMIHATHLRIFYRGPNPDMSGPQPGHVWPINLILGYPNLIWFLSWILETIVGHVCPRPGHVQVSDTQRLDFFGGYKRPPTHL
jgi:hypothetical protein